MRRIPHLLLIASSLLCFSTSQAAPEARLQGDLQRVKHPMAKSLMRFVSSNKVPLPRNFAPYKLVKSRHGAFPQLLLPGPRAEHRAADTKAIHEALWGQPGSENLVQFFKSPRRKGSMHHLYIAMLMPDGSGKMVPTVFDNLDDQHHPVTKGLRRNPARISEGTSDRYGVFVDYDPKVMKQIRDFFSLASGPQGREKAIGTFDPNAGPSQARQKRDRRAGCTSYTAACRLENGKSMVEEVGAQDQLIATSLLSSLLNDSKRIAFSALHNPQVGNRRMLLREDMLHAYEVNKRDLERAARELEDPHSLWFYTR